MKMEFEQSNLFGKEKKERKKKWREGNNENEI